MLARRMIIMLVAAALVFGGIFGFIAFGHYMRDKFMHSMGFPAADRLDDGGRHPGLAAEARSRRQPCVRSTARI